MHFVFAEAEKSTENVVNRELKMQGVHIATFIRMSLAN